MRKSAALLGLCLALAWGVGGCRGDGGKAPPEVDAAAGAAPDVGVEASSPDVRAATPAVPDARPDADAPPFAYECFSGTPRSHYELLNACWPDTVVAVAKSVEKLPGGLTVGAPLPPIP